MSRTTWSIMAVLLAAAPVATRAEAPKLTVYGILDVGVAYQNRTASGSNPADTGEQLGVISGTILPTILGVTGTHQLPGGNRFEFQFEGGTSLETGAPDYGMNPVWGRNANAGVAGNWGSVRVGFELTPFLGDIGGVDPQGLSQAGSALAFYLQGLGVTGLFDNRMIQYRSPNLSGLQVTAGLGTGKVPGSTSRGNELQATATYAIAGLNLAAGYLTVNDPAASGKSAESWWGGAGYRFKPVTVRAMAQDIKTADGNVHNLYWAAGIELKAASRLTAKYGYYDYRDQDVSANQAQAHTLALTYALDGKVAPSEALIELGEDRAESQTHLYLGWTMVDNSGTVRVPPLNGSSWGSSGAPGDASTSAVYAGFNYTF